MKILLLGVVLAGCGGDDNLTCEYLAGPDNCWKTTATAAESCLPADGDIGALAADNGSCSYASGQVITFAHPLTLPLDNNATWDFTVTTNGAECMHYVDDNEGFDLTVGGDTVSENIAGAGSLSISCPDGSEFSTSHPFDLLNCPDSNFGNLPGNTNSSSATSVTFGLLNANSDSVLSVFDCQR